MPCAAGGAVSADAFVAFYNSAFADVYRHLVRPRQRQTALLANVSFLNSKSQDVNDSVTVYPSKEAASQVMDALSAFGQETKFSGSGETRLWQNIWVQVDRSIVLIATGPMGSAASTRDRQARLAMLRACSRA